MANHIFQLNRSMLFAGYSVPALAIHDGRLRCAKKVFSIDGSVGSQLVNGVGGYPFDITTWDVLVPTMIDGQLCQ